MAYQPQQFDAERLSKLQSRFSDLTSELESSRTAMAPGTAPSVEDLANEASSKALGKEIEVLKGKELAEKWYGKGRDEETFKGEGSQQSLLMRGLNKLSVPLYATAGAVEGALGIGSKNGIMDNITANVKEREGFGNILRRSGMNKYASMPIGFALDVMLDPINWATAGTAALLPRVAVGLGKGGLKGAATGAASRVIPMGLKTADIISAGGISRARNTAQILKKNTGIVPSKMQKLSSLIGNTSKTLANIGSDASSAYDDLIGKEIVTSKSGVKYAKDILREKGPGFYHAGEKYSVGDSFENFVKDALPGGTGENIIQTFKYSPANWLRLKRIESTMIENADEIKSKTGLEFLPKTAGQVEVGADGTKQVTEELKERITSQLDKPNTGWDMPKIFDEASPVSGNAARVFNDGIDVAENVPDIVKAENSAEIIRNLGGEAMNDVTAEDVMKIMSRWEDSKNLNTTGVKWYDDSTNYLRNNFKVKNTQVVAKLMDAYSAYISAFKLAKIGLTPAAHMNAVLGNTTMIKMAGIDVENPQLLALISKMAKMSGQKGPASQKLLAEMFSDPAWLEYAKKDRLGFVGTFNFSLDDIAKRDEFLETAIQTIIRNAKKKGGIGEDAAVELTGNAEFREKLMKEMAEVIPPSPGHVEYTSYVLNEIKDNPNALNKLSNFVAEKAKKEAARVARIKAGKQIPGDELPVAGFGTKAADVALNKSMDFFGGIDPIFRMGTAIHITKNGLSEGEMKVVGKMFGLTADDVLDVTKDAISGEKRFKLSPEKATELAGEIFLNYSAMPAAVKMLRTLPLLGAPFASFAYGMTARTGKTALYNPAIFNKTNFLLQEMSGDKGPLEKKAMESKYYSWFNDPGMVKVPFVEKFPLYANVTNMIPYYSMNMFTPSERKYGETLPDSVMSFLDKFPILQDPAGQVMFDYIIQPMLISQGQVPQGSFGQSLYPKDATGVEKLGYATRQLAESVTPGVAGLAALGTAPFTSTGEHIQYTPSYRYRQIAEALRGNTSLGIPSKEPASSRTLRTLGSTFGIPTHRMDTSFTEGEVKKQIKNAQ